MSWKTRKKTSHTTSWFHKRLDQLAIVSFGNITLEEIGIFYFEGRSIQKKHVGLYIRELHKFFEIEAALIGLS